MDNKYRRASLEHFPRQGEVTKERHETDAVGKRGIRGVARTGKGDNGSLREEDKGPAEN